MSKLKNTLTAAVILIAFFGVEQALNAEAQAKELEISIRDDPSVVEEEELAAYFMPENEYLYNKECASCHYLYSPTLLPAKAWYNIIQRNNKHFGENLKLSYKTMRDLTLYLTDTSTDRGLMSAEQEAIAGLRNKKGKTTTRVSETTYILEAHKEVERELFINNSAKTLSNCVACHDQERDLSTLIYR